MKFNSSLNDLFYVNRFSETLKLKNQYNGTYSLLDLGVGEDKSLPDPRIIETLVSSLKMPKNHKYTDRGINELLQSAKDYLKRRFDIYLSDDEIALTMGSKQGLSILPSFIVDEGLSVVITDPGYIVLGKVSTLFKAQLIALPLEEKNNYYPDFSLLSEEEWKKVSILSLNYPNNPTGQVANKAFYEEVIALAKKYDFLVVNDAAYLEFTYNEKPLSILSIEGAKDVAVELYTLSKSHNMTGYRIGFIAGNKDVIAKFLKYVDYYDSGQFAPIEYAASVALQNDDIVDRLKAKYYFRLENLVDILNENGIEARIPNGTFYLYVKVPSCFKSSFEFAKCLLNDVGILVIPYSNAGEYVRLSVTFETVNTFNFYMSFNKRIKEFVEKYHI